ncbi:hypothetical protein ACSHWB_18650 [Lentzea sp. HUAS TT2]|uniref:hypothetical protein n=1 Tax=Lentzea sp. HUAS TT2 TaxID=3447454 RepID=UPI003F6F5FC8
MVVLTGTLAGVPAAAQAVPCAVTDTMIKAGATRVTKGPDLAANNWSNASFHVGNLAQPLRDNLRARVKDGKTHY